MITPSSAEQEPMQPSWKNGKRVVGSKTLEERLQRLVLHHQQVEQEFQHSQQKFWTIVFLDVSASNRELWTFGENVVNTVLSIYQDLVRPVLLQQGACFIESGGGPQIVCCFEDPTQAVRGADAVHRVLEDWNREQEEVLRLRPAIGIHQGHIAFHEGVIHQSNTNNLAKRIQTEAEPGQILVSAAVYTSLKENPSFHAQFLRTASLKNIPEPQELYQVRVLCPPSTEPSSESPSPEGSSLSDSKEKKKYRWVFVFVDVCGSTRKFWQMGDREASRLIQEYQDVCYEIFRRYGCCYVKKCEGDQIVAGFEFPEADHAAFAAACLLQTLSRRNMDLPASRKIRAAIGIHEGAVGLQDDSLIVTGDMHFGKQIQSRASEDEILVSESVYGRVCEELRAYMEETTESEEDWPMKLYTLRWLHAPVRKPGSPTGIRSPHPLHPY